MSRIDENMTKLHELSFKLLLPPDIAPSVFFVHQANPSWKECRVNEEVIAETEVQSKAKDKFHYKVIMRNCDPIIVVLPSGKQYRIRN